MRIVWLALFAFTPSVASAADEVWWSLRPLSTPALPQAAAKEADWVRTPVDAFVWAKLREKGLSPAPEADKRVLVRRLYFDLIGLPPTPAEVEAFVADASANAYERLAGYHCLCGGGR